MEAFWILLSPISTLLIIVGIGFAAAKTRYVRPEHQEGISRLLTRITYPSLMASIILSPSLPKSAITGSLVYIVASSITVLFMLGTGFLLSAAARTPRDSHPVFSLMSAFSNVAFLGIPLCRALYGEEGALAAAMINMGQDLVLWTVGITLLDRYGSGTGPRRIGLFNPVTIVFAASIALKMAGVVLPEPVYSAVSGVGSCTPYVAMLFLGMVMAGVNLKGMLLKWRIYYFLLFKQIIVPSVIMAVLFGVLGGFLSEMQKTLLLVEFSTPCVISLIPFFRERGLDYVFAGEIAFCGVVASALTIPLVLSAARALF